MTETSGASKRSYGWVVAFAGFGTNLALGVLYSWSVFADSLRSQGWSATHTQIPYMIAAAVFALLMVPAGSLQDRFGPKPMLSPKATAPGRSTQAVTPRRSFAAGLKSLP